MSNTGHSKTRFAIASCSLGSLLVAATPLGVRAIFIGDDPTELERDLEREFPHAERADEDAPLRARVAEVLHLVENPRQESRISLDPRGTPFQERVWRALRRVPAGSTATYADIAAAIGAPRAARAVARACAANVLAVAIPCHRIARRDGKPAAFRWGVDRRRALLAREATA